MIIIWPRPLMLLCLALSAVAGGSPAVAAESASGYVANQVCANCHKSHYDSFQHVGMSQSLKRPRHARRVERFGETFFHEASQRYYQVRRNEAGMTFRRFQRDRHGDVVNEIEIPIDWVLGSGNHARSYLHQNDHGELFQLPVGWYAKGGYWEMSPGFETRDHDGIGRRVTRECMFCHNAYPGSELDDYADAEIFPHDMPEGIGCQRCHGPGAKHVGAVSSGGSLETIRASIVNPGNLSGEVRDSVCLQCHLLPSVAIVGPRRFGRGDYSFRPGELLTDYMVHLDIRERGVPEPERFEINHHGYRLLKSACYQQSEGALGCISCHDPHVKPERRSFRTKVAGVCRDCHGDEVHPGSSQHADCATCHMPTRRTRDVIHVTMSDHWISRGPFNLEELVEPVEAQTRPISEVRVLPFGNPPEGIDAQAYAAVGAMRAGRSLDAASRSLLQVIQQKDYDHYTPYLDFVRAQLQQGRFASAEAGARGLVSVDSRLHVAWALMGIAQAGQGEFHQAIVSFRQSLKIHPDPETHFNLATAYVNTGELAPAQTELERALDLRPTFSAAHRLLGQIELAGDARGNARRHFVEALRLDPGDRATYDLLVPLLKELGDPEAAEQYHELGRRSAR